MNNFELKREQKVKEYIYYINDHIENVKRAYYAYGEFLCSALNLNIKHLYLLVEAHDKSKLSEEEFEPYRKHFYPVKTSERSNNEEFEKAWEHHWKNNRHHEDWWHYIRMEMPEICIAEMLLDWKAMSMHFNNSIVDFYNKNKEKKQFTDREKKIIESVIYELD